MADEMIMLLKTMVQLIQRYDLYRGVTYTYRGATYTEV